MSCNVRGVVSKVHKVCFGVSLDVCVWSWLRVIAYHLHSHWTCGRYLSIELCGLISGEDLSGDREIDRNKESVLCVNFVGVRQREGGRWWKEDRRGNESEELTREKWEERLYRERRSAVFKHQWKHETHTDSPSQTEGGPQEELGIITLNHSFSYTSAGQ